MALMCMSWDVGVNSAASQEPPGQEVAPVSLRLNYYLSRFSEHPWMVPPPRAMATAKSFLGIGLSLLLEKVLLLCATQRRGGIVPRNLPDQVMRAGHSSSRDTARPLPVLPSAIQRPRNKGWLPLQAPNLPSELSLSSLS